MALAPCPDCQRDVSPRAPVCPHCGAPIATIPVTAFEPHGETEGLFMRSLNFGCSALVFFVVLLVVWAITMKLWK